MQAVATWVCLDPERSVPMRFDDDFAAVYARERPRARRQRPPPPSGPPAGASAEPWSFRATDLDLAGHVNNSRYWEASSPICSAARSPGASTSRSSTGRRGRAGEAPILRSDGGIWIADGDGRVLASILPARSGV